MQFMLLKEKSNRRQRADEESHLVTTHSRRSGPQTSMLAMFYCGT